MATDPEVRERAIELMNSAKLADGDEKTAYLAQLHEV